VAEGGERSAGTLIIYGDDDVLSPPTIVAQHLAAQRAAAAPTAFGTRRISVGEGERREWLLEATGTISVRASAVPPSAFSVGGVGVGEMHSACKLSDDCA
jgi:hypothetical protein